MRCDMCICMLMLACSNREQVAEAAANALEGFGLVTLASLMPVLTVELLAIGLKWMYTHEDIISMKPPPIDHNSLLERAPFREIYFAVRAILPLCAALVALVVLVLKKPLPEFTYYLEDSPPPPPSPAETLSRGNSLDGTGSVDQSSAETEMNSEFENDGRGGERVPKKKRKSQRPSLESISRRSMDFYRSMAEYSKKSCSKGSLALYGEAIMGVTAYSAAQARGISSSFRQSSTCKQTATVLACRPLPPFLSVLCPAFLSTCIPPRLLA